MMESGMMAVLLRGINVGGSNAVNMKELKALLESLGFAKVQTYIQSGNIVLDSAGMAAGTIAAVIGDAMRAAFGFSPGILVRTAEELGNIVRDNPFPVTEKEEMKRLQVLFLGEEPAAAAAERLGPLAEGADQLHLAGKQLYVLYENSISQSPLFKVTFDKLLGVPVTARNWNTVQKLAAMAEGQP